MKIPTKKELWKDIEASQNSDPQDEENGHDAVASAATEDAASIDAVSNSTDAQPVPEVDQSGSESSLHCATRWARINPHVIPVDPVTGEPTVDRDAWFADPNPDKIADHFRAHLDHGVGLELGPDQVVLKTHTPVAEEAFWKMVEEYGIPPKVALRQRDTAIFLYGLAEPLPASRASMEGRPPDSIEICGEGSLLVVSGPGVVEDICAAQCSDDLEALSNEFVGLFTGYNWDLRQAARASVPTEDRPSSPALPLVKNTPLAQRSLRGRASEYEARAVAATPLLGSVCLSGEVTLWYGAPNAGKTLIGMALLDETVRAGRVVPGNVYYINADDSSEGFATKLRLADDLGIHTLCPGQRGFAPEQLAAMLSQMASTNAARGVVVIVDTLKKFADLMQKREASEFGSVCRRFTMIGGTILLLAHTNKNPNASGKLVYAGTADFLQDADAAYVLSPLENDGEETVVEFRVEKQRGIGAKPAAYAYAGGPGISYEERLASVRLVDPDAIESIQRAADERADETVIAAIKACIRDDIDKKMSLAKAAAERVKLPVRAAMRVLERYTGDDPEQHHWTYRVKERGAKVFELLDDRNGD